MREIKKKYAHSEFMKLVHKDRKVCRCGHVIYFRYDSDKRLCGCCGRMVYRNDKAKFKDKLNERIRNERRFTKNN